MQYIDYFHNPDQIVQQYGQEVTIGEIRDKLMIAFSKLDLYQKLVKAAKKIGDFQYHDQFTKTAEQYGEGYEANQDELLCDICNKKLIDRDVLIKLRQHIGKQASSQNNNWMSFFNSSIFSFDVGNGGAAGDGEAVA